MDLMFSNRDLKKLIIPLIIEQFLGVTVGMADIIMISRAGESAVSGVSLVDTINILLINIFAALATGGAVVSAQYLGRRDSHTACNTAKQLLIISTLISISIMFFVLIARRIILTTIFGNVEPSIIENAEIYFLLSALSYPFLSIYNSCAALFRSMGNSKISMLTSLCMNIINIAGNAILIYGFDMGVAGIGIATLISRTVAAIIMMVLIKKPRQEIFIDRFFSIRFKPHLIKQILNVGVPNSLENSMFQIGKILVLSLVSSFGTAAIAANAVSSTVAGFAILPGMATGIALITIVGQCVGAANYEQTIYYTKKLMKMTFVALGILNLFIIIFTPSIVSLYNLSPETAQTTIGIIRYHSLCCIIIWPLSFSLPNALRAANDAKFTMVVAIISMWTCRIGLSYILGSTLGLGVFGIWVAMTIDWVFRTICFLYRFFKGSWKRNLIHATEVT